MKTQPATKARLGRQDLRRLRRESLLRRRCPFEMGQESTYFFLIPYSTPGEHSKDIGIHTPTRALSSGPTKLPLWSRSFRSLNYRNITSYCLDYLLCSSFPVATWSETLQGFETGSHLVLIGSASHLQGLHWTLSRLFCLWTTPKVANRSRPF